MSHRLVPIQLTTRLSSVNRARQINILSGFDCYVQLCQPLFAGKQPATPRLQDFQASPPVTVEVAEEELEAVDDWAAFLAEPWDAVHRVTVHLRGVPYASVLLSQMCRHYLHILTNKVTLSAYVAQVRMHWLLTS